MYNPWYLLKFFVSMITHTFQVVGHKNIDDYISQSYK